MNYNIIDLKNQINILNENIKNNKKQKDENENKINKLTNDQNKVETDSKKIKNKYDQYEEKIKELLLIQEESQRRFGDSNDRYKIEIGKCQDEMKKLKVEYDKLNNNYKILEKQLDTYKNNNIIEKYTELVKERDELLIQFKNLQTDIDILNKQSKDKDKLIEKLNSDLRESQEVIKSNDKTIQSLRDNEQGIYDEWKKYANETESKIEELQLQLQTILNTKKDVPVSLILNDQKDEVIAIVDKDGDVKALPEEIPVAPAFDIFPITEIKKGESKKLIKQIEKDKKENVNMATKSTVNLLEQIQNKKLKSIVKCEEGFIWDSKLGKCLLTNKSNLISNLQDTLAEKLSQRRQVVEDDDF